MYRPVVKTRDNPFRKGINLEELDFRPLEANKMEEHQKHWLGTPKWSKKEEEPEPEPKEEWYGKKTMSFSQWAMNMLSTLIIGIVWGFSIAWALYGWMWSP